MRTLIPIVLGLSSFAATAETFNIEDDHLAAVPPVIEAAIRPKLDRELAACHLAGKAIDLGAPGTTYAVTTSQACGWGAAQGPIWIVRTAADGAKVVLDSNGYSLTVGTQATHGLRQIAISAGTAGWYEQGLWKYDGTRYRRATFYQFTDDNPASCRAHPKICPWDFSGR